MRRVCVPERYWLTTRPGREVDGKLGVHRIAALAPFELHEMRLAIGVEEAPPSNSRGVPGWSSDGHGQKTPICSSIFS